MPATHEQHSVISLAGRASAVARALLLAALAPAAAAQSPPVWIPLDPQQPAGSAAQIVYDAPASSAQDFFLDIFVPGYWRQELAPGDGLVYQRISVPGLGHFGQLGAPDLPVARLSLAVGTTATQVHLVSVTDLDPHAHTGLPPYPWVVQALDESVDPGGDPGPGDPDGAPEVFVKNAAIYAGPALFPASSGSASTGVRSLLGVIPGATPEIYPARWNPPLQRLEISGHLRVHLQAAGPAVTHPPLTQDRAALAAATLHNWSDLTALFPINTAFFEGRYLIVTPKAYAVALLPLVEHHKARGFEVDVLALETLPSTTCAGIRAAIKAWHASGNSWAEHYCLLVGDTSVLPACDSPTTPAFPGDDLYGSPGDGDLHEEVCVGRLSVDGVADLTGQLGKLLGYAQDQTGQHHDEVLLVSHAQGAPGQYQAAQAAVLAEATSWPIAPSFEVLQGGAPGVTNATVRAAIDAGVGLVAYRGHGSQTTWWKWNLQSESFHKNDVLALANAHDPAVVWAFDCWNNDLAHAPAGSADSLGETWLEHVGGGAVAHYGAVGQVAGAFNDELERQMFAGLYAHGFTRHGQLIAWAEQQAADVQPGPGPWAQLLLGDPAQRVRRRDPLPLTLSFPPVVPVCAGPGCSITVRVTRGNQPVPGALVGLYKPGLPGEPDDILVNGYTDPNGSVTFPVGPADLVAVIDVTGSDPDGNEAFGSAGVVSGAWTNVGMALPGVAGKPIFLGDGPLVAASQVSLDLVNAAANAPAGLFVSFASVPVPFKCGTLVAVPWALLLPLGTDAEGEVHLAGLWPNGIPAQTQLWFQFALADAAAPCGVALSNALRATTP